MNKVSSTRWLHLLSVVAVTVVGILFMAGLASTPPTRAESPPPLVLASTTSSSDCNNAARSVGVCIQGNGRHNIVVGVGDVITYTINLNSRQASGVGLQLTDTIPARLEWMGFVGTVPGEQCGAAGCFRDSGTTYDPATRSVYWMGYLSPAGDTVPQVQISYLARVKSTPLEERLENTVLVAALDGTLVGTDSARVKIVGADANEGAAAPTGAGQNDVYGGASSPTLGQTQSHTFYRPGGNHRGDIDWVKFDAQAGYVYTIRTSDLVTPTDTMLSLFQLKDGSLLLQAFNDDYQAAIFDVPDQLWLKSTSRIVWTAPAAGTYYLKVEDYNSSALGAYSLTISAEAPPPTATPTPLPPTATPTQTPTPTATPRTAFIRLVEAQNEANPLRCAEGGSAAVVLGTNWGAGPVLMWLNGHPIDPNPIARSDRTFAYLIDAARLAQWLQVGTNTIKAQQGNTIATATFRSPCPTATPTPTQTPSPTATTEPINQIINTNEGANITSNNRKYNFNFPAGALPTTASGNLNFAFQPVPVQPTSTPTPQATPRPGETPVATPTSAPVPVYAFNIELMDTTTGERVHGDLAQPLYIAVKFDPAELRGMNPNSLRLYLKDPLTGRYEALPTQVDWTNRIMTGTITHLTQFEVQAQPWISKVIFPAIRLGYVEEVQSFGGW